MRNDIEEKAEKIREKLRYIYGVRIEIRIGTSEKCSFDIKENANTTDIVAYLRADLDAAILWNNYYRKIRGSKVHCFNWQYHINEEKLRAGYIDVEHKHFRGADGLEPENVLIMSFDTLQENAYDLFDLLENADENMSESEEAKNRDKRTVKQYNRDAEFRNKVMEKYGTRCVICGCEERKVLQAAHIRAVADGGSDDPKNGVCLCANHHLMLDHDLIRIDFRKWRLHYIADSVKQMPWYKQAQERDFRLYLPDGFDKEN